MANYPRAQLELANTPTAQQPQLERAWFGPHAILEAVERLVVSDNANADAGWTLEQIKVSLMQTHIQRQRQQEIQEELPLNFLDDDDMLRVALSRLLQMGDLKMVGVGEDYYTLSPPYLPPWFRPEAVLDAVSLLDGINAGGWTWEHIRDSMKQKYQPDQPLPPDLDTVLRAMLSVLGQKGHLTWGDSGPHHYTRRQAPALVEPNPIEIPGYLWCYYLGYKLGASDGDGWLDDSADSGPDEDSARMSNNPNIPSWFGPGTVLQEIERLARMDQNYAIFGFTCKEITDSLMGTHKKNHQKLAQSVDLEAMLRGTLATLSKRGYLTTEGVVARQSYTLSMAPPAAFSFPTWFRPQAVLQAVGELDDVNNNDNGSSTGAIRRYFRRKHGLLSSYTQWDCFTKLLQTMLSVLRQRGYIRWGDRGLKQYTRRDAPATVDIPDDYLLCYYAGYNLARDVGVRKDVEVEMESDQPPNDGLRRRTISSATAETQPLLTHSRSSADDERANDEAKKEEKRRKQQRFRYMILRLCFSFFGHGIVFALSFVPGFGEEASGHDKQEASKKWLRWGVMNLIAPVLLFGLMMVIQLFYIDLEDISPDKNTVKRCKRVNLATISCSKIVYFAISEVPVGANVIARAITAHAVAFLIDMGGAIFLYRNHSFLEQDNMG